LFGNNFNHFPIYHLNIFTSSKGWEIITSTPTRLFSDRFTFEGVLPDLVACRSWDESDDDDDAEVEWSRFWLDLSGAGKD